jgi:hypothetical protein
VDTARPVNWAMWKVERTAAEIQQLREDQPPDWLKEALGWADEGLLWSRVMLPGEVGSVIPDMVACFHDGAHALWYRWQFIADPVEPGIREFHPSLRDSAGRKIPKTRCQKGRLPPARTSRPGVWQPRAEQVTLALVPIALREGLLVSVAFGQCHECGRCFWG